MKRFIVTMLLSATSMTAAAADNQCFAKNTMPTLMLHWRGTQILPK